MPVLAAAVAVALLPGLHRPDPTGARPLARAVLAPSSALAVVGVDTRRSSVVTERGAGGVWTAGAPAWSPDGRSIAFVSQRCAACAPELAIARGGSVGRLPIAAGMRAAGSPSWSPGGDRVVVPAADETGETALFIVRTRRGAAHELPGTDDAGAAAWSPDGATIVYSREVDEVRQLFLADTRGRVLRVLTGRSFSADQPSWAPDGSAIAFARLDRTFTWDVCILRPARRRVRCVSRGPANERDPAWSPSGRWIAFAGDQAGGRVGSRRIYVVGADGRGLRAVTPAGVDASAPAWSPDGSRLAFARRAILRLRASADRR